MNVDRVLRQVSRRLSTFPEELRTDALDALREELARERRRVDPGSIVEAERERRQEAEILREVLEAITHQALLEDTLHEVLKQLARLVDMDSCSIGLREADGTVRVIAARGFADESAVIGMIYQDAMTDAVLADPTPRTIADVTGDDRFAQVAGTEQIRSWAGVPLMVEGDLIGVLSLDRNRVEPFDEEDIHRAKALAFTAGAAIRKARILAQVRRYANLMERVVEVDQAVFAGDAPPDVARRILNGALRIGGHPGGLLVVPDGRGVTVAAAAGTLAHAQGPAASELLSRTSTRLEDLSALGDLVPSEPASTVRLVPLATADDFVGTLVLLDSEGGDDLLLESYGSRAAAAYLHVLRDAR